AACGRRCGACVIAGRRRSRVRPRRALEARGPHFRSSFWRDRESRTRCGHSRGHTCLRIGPRRRRAPTRCRKDLTRMRARVFVTLKPSVFDPQGRTIADALHSLGYGGVEDVRQGKYFELDLATAEAAQARVLAAEVADKLLANPVIESYRIEVE